MGKKIESVKKSETQKASPKPAVKKPTSTAKTASPSASNIKPNDKAEKKTATTKKQAATANSPSHAEIALRAYYIAENRYKHGIPGNPAHDWIEAEHQLNAERNAKKLASKAK